MEQVANRATAPLDGTEQELQPEAVNGPHSAWTTSHHPETNRENVGEKEQLKQRNKFIGHRILPVCILQI